jgi:hypothetical protein
MLLMIEQPAFGDGGSVRQKPQCSLNDDCLTVDDKRLGDEECTGGSTIIDLINADQLATTALPRFEEQFDETPS